MQHLKIQNFLETNSNDYTPDLKADAGAMDFPHLWYLAAKYITKDFAMWILLRVENQLPPCQL